MHLCQRQDVHFQLMLHELQTNPLIEQPFIQDLTVPSCIEKFKSIPHTVTITMITKSG